MRRPSSVRKGSISVSFSRSRSQYSSQTTSNGLEHYFEQNSKKFRQKKLIREELKRNILQCVHRILEPTFVLFVERSTFEPLLTLIGEILNSLEDHPVEVKLEIVESLTKKIRLRHFKILLESPNLKRLKINHALKDFKPKILKLYARYMYLNANCYEKVQSELTFRMSKEYHVLTFWYKWHYKYRIDTNYYPVILYMGHVIGSIELDQGWSEKYHPYNEVALPVLNKHIVRVDRLTPMMRLIIDIRDFRATPTSLFFRDFRKLHFYLNLVTETELESLTYRLAAFSLKFSSHLFLNLNSRVNRTHLRCLETASERTDGRVYLYNRSRYKWWTPANVPFIPHFY